MTTNNDKTKLGGQFTFPGTSSAAHLRENLAAGELTLSTQTLAELDGIAAAAGAVKH